jgi:hypothetical protein
MKKSWVFLCVIIFIFAAAGSGKATPMKWTNLKDFDPTICIGWYESKSYIPDISDGADGYNGMLMSGNDYFTGYHLTVSLHDDGGCWACWDGACVDQPGIIAGGNNGAAPIPEPATMLLMGVGLLTIGTLGKHINKS